ncbi:MAG: sulfotransferase [Rhodospirillales bacterium]|nr:sulfotransferase [Rhodospirillales bacterium]
MSSPKSFVVNGLRRSGTTLLERVFDSQPNITCFSFKFDILTFIAQAKGLDGKGAVMFEDFTSEEFSLSERSIAEWRLFMAESLTGALFGEELAYGKISEKATDQIYGMSFDNYMKIIRVIEDADDPADISSILGGIAAHLNKAAVGIHWTFSHRYAPVFLRSDNAYWIEIIRDPYERRMSDKLRSGTHFLDFIRHTQDGLNFATDFKHPRFMFVRFEDLIDDTKTTLKKLSDFLDTEIEETELIHPMGGPFKPNTSLNTLDGKSTNYQNGDYGSRIGALSRDKWASKMTDYERSLITRSINLRGLYEARPGTAGSGARAAVALAGMKFRRGLKIYYKKICKWRSRPVGVQNHQNQRRSPIDQSRLPIRQATIHRSPRPA